MVQEDAYLLLESLSTKEASLRCFRLQSVGPSLDSVASPKRHLMQSTQINSVKTAYLLGTAIAWNTSAQVN